MCAVVAACNSGAAPPAASMAPSRPAQTAATTTAQGLGDEALPAPSRAVAVADLAGDFTCGPWSTKDLAKNDQPLLENRVRARFFSGASPEGDAASGKLEVRRDASTLFVGARETFMRGDDLFERRAAKAATFGGDAYEAVTLPGRDGKIAIVTGVRNHLKEIKGEMVALAHGWFLDPNRDVIDIAVFVSPSAVTDMRACRLFAQKILSTAAQGPRMLSYGKNTDVDTQVSYAKFSYRLPPDWVLASSMGIHDFARMRFRKRGVFPSGYTDLQIGLDSHPGDWTSPGEKEGERAGKLLGLAVSWHLTKDRPAAEPTLGAWTVSSDVVKRDHAVASILASSAADRDEAIRFAESIRAGR